MELTDQQLLAMSDQELFDLLGQLGMSAPSPWTRDKVLDLIMRVALSASDS